jgi:N,N'-diacetyllegionaminate synthase
VTNHTFIIAEAGSSHDLDMTKARRLIEAAKECGADAVKFQWTSNAKKMAERRGHPEWAKGYEEYLELDESWLHLLKATCDEVRIEFMCTVYLIEDISVIAPLVKRFKVSNFESSWLEFVDAHFPYNKQVIISKPVSVTHERDQLANVRTLQCVSRYPCPIYEVRLEAIRGCKYTDYGRRMTWLPNCDGLSDHTANVLTGAAAVAAGARIIEAHIRLDDTSPDNPDYKHSLRCGKWGEFQTYVENIRTVERML